MLVVVLQFDDCVGYADDGADAFPAEFNGAARPADVDSDDVNPNEDDDAGDAAQVDVYAMGADDDAAVERDDDADDDDDY